MEAISVSGIIIFRIRFDLFDLITVIAGEITRESTGTSRNVLASGI